MERVYNLIASRGPAGATDDEVARSLHMPSASASARRNDLARAGQVRKSGERRPTRTGRRADVWIAIEGGSGAGVKKHPPRPTRAALRAAAAEVRALTRPEYPGEPGASPELCLVLAWIERLAGTGA